MIVDYRYELVLQCRYKDTRINIDMEHVKSIVFDYDYDNNNTPILLLTLIVDKKINDAIIDNKDDAKIYFALYKYINDEEKIKDAYIEEEFIYFLSDKKNKKDSLDYQDDTQKDFTTTLILGLVKKELIDTNKQSIMNTNFMNCRVIDMICKYSNNRKLLIEPPNNEIKDKLVVTPISTYTEYIRFLDNHVNIFKDSYYRLFYDYDRTYLVSGKAKPVYADKEVDYPVVFNILDNADVKSKIQGQETKDNIIKILVDELDADFKNNRNASSMMVNQVIGIDSKGNMERTKISTTDNASILNRTDIVRYSTDNMDNNKSIKSSIENTSLTVNIIKRNIDSSKLTINREYMIYSEKDEYKNGHYMLLRKREIFSREEDHLTLVCLLTFCKISS